MAIYATSRGFVLPSSAAEMEAAQWFNMWRTRLWPYTEVVSGDTLYWYEAPARRLRWRSVLGEVGRFAYESKAKAVERLGLTGEQARQEYLRDAPDSGYCLAWRVRTAEPVDIQKPEAGRFPHKGWLRLQGEDRATWLAGEVPAEDVGLDGVVAGPATVGSLMRLSEVLVGVSPQRVEALVSLAIRRDGRLVRALKRACGHRRTVPRRWSTCGSRSSG